MEWKYEPVSPSGSPGLLNVEEDWFIYEDQSVEIPNNAAEEVTHENQLTRAQVATKFLEELELEWIKEGKISHICFTTFISVINTLIALLNRKEISNIL